MPPQSVVGVVIRRAQPSDAHALADLCAQLGYPTSAREAAERLTVLEQRDDTVVYVAEAEGGRVIGWVQVCLTELLIAARYAEIGGLVVDEQQRGKGVGQQLMTTAEEWARSRGCVEVRLRSNAIRESAHRFYEALGYRCIKTSLTFQKDLITHPTP